jgi:hypothetical protein
MNEISINNQLLTTNKSFGWRNDRNYTCLDLGTMKNAIVIKKEEIGDRFLISLRSHFPFPEEYYNYRFDVIEMAISSSTNYLINWVEELNKQLFSNQ